MKVFFVIESFSGVNTGVGGHYRSIREVVSMLSGDHDVFVLTLGDLPSPVFSSMNTYFHVECTAGFLSRVTALRGYLGAINKKVNESFLVLSVGAIDSLLVCELSALGRGIATGLVKPGGKSFNIRWPYYGASVMTFHESDFLFFGGMRSSSPLACAPGRVSRPIYDEQYLNGFCSEAGLFSDKKSIKILMVSRISDVKSESLRAFSDVTFRLKDVTSATILGFVQSGDLAQSLINEYGASLVSRAEYTEAASKAMYSVDIVCGIGRTAIEGMACGKPVFIPMVSDIDNKFVLCAVTKKNWSFFACHNFTGRARLSDAPEVLDISDVILDPIALDVLGEQASEIFEKYLSPEASKLTWKKFLLNAASHRRRLLFFLMALVFKFANEVRRYIIRL